MGNTEISKANPCSLYFYSLARELIRNHHCLWLSIILFLLFADAGGQTPDYKSIFGADWEKAEQFVSENSAWMAERLEKYNVDYCEALAVIFPELIRYSALRDRMETTMLKVLYVNVGQDYANFSIGKFQMKPSFAEEIAGALSLAGSGRMRRLIHTPGDFKNEYDYRSQVIADLEDVHKQLDYLILFLKICSEKYNTGRLDNQERIRFLATAYNYGLKSTKEEVEKAAGKKFFSTKLIKSVTYSYCDISLFWYNNYCPGINNILSKLP